MIEVELALVAFMLIVIAWQIAGLHELLFRRQLDLLGYFSKIAKTRPRSRVPSAWSR